MSFGAEPAGDVGLSRVADALTRRSSLTRTSVNAYPAIYTHAYAVSERRTSCFWRGTDKHLN